MLFSAGFGISKVRIAAARRLQNERAVEWILQRAKGGISPAALHASLSGLAAIKGLSPEMKGDLQTLQVEETAGMQRDRDALERIMDGER
jgi:hypothetical protein